MRMKRRIGECLVLIVRKLGGSIGEWNEMDRDSKERSEYLNGTRRREEVIE